MVTMKNLLATAPSKVFVLCGLGLLMTLGAFWHHQVNQTQIDRMNVLGQGLGTCFNRITQTFTATMIKDIHSPYLNQNFMALSDECLNETIKGINPFRQNVGKGYETLNRLISETSWFHERVLKVNLPLVAGKPQTESMNTLSDKYGKMEGLKTNLIDVVDETISKLKSIQANDEILMGAGLIIFVLSLSLLSLQEYNRLHVRSTLEKEAMNLLQTNQTSVGAMVDSLVGRALYTQGMPVTTQVFRDYHGEVLERMAGKYVVEKTAEATKPETMVEATPVNVSVKAEEPVEVIHSSPYRSSLKEVLVSLQNIHGKESMQTSDVRDVQLSVEYEALEQMLNAAINKLETFGKEKRIMISNQIHSDRAIINLFLGSGIFSAQDLEYSAGGVSQDSDMNLMIIKEMASQNNAQWFLENKTDRHGKIMGVGIRFTVNRVPKENRAKNLISVVKGKKRDLTRDMVN
jgi:hypothetical protein